MTVKELREKLATLPDDMPVMVDAWDSDGDGWREPAGAVGVVPLAQFHEHGGWRAPGDSDLPPIQTARAVVLFEREWFAPPGARDAIEWVS